jgi:hypothetical protein
MDDNVERRTCLVDEYIAECPQPLGAILAEFHARVLALWPDVTSRHSPTRDLEGWIDYAAPSGSAFAGVRFRRETPSLTVVLAAKPKNDPMEWVHPNVGRVRRLPFALGVPRPFRKDIGEDEWKYVLDLVRQVYEDTRPA